jgi:uncharacterized protein YdaU (DUF1376 family)
MSKAWMPMYWGDYKSDTSHLSTLEHGAYLLLIAHYWQTGILPTDDNRLARIAGLSMEEWLCVRIAVAQFFTKNWKHNRIEKELKNAADKSEKAQKSAANRWNKKEKSIMRTQCDGNAKAYANDMLSQSQSQSHIDTNVSIIDASPKPKRAKPKTKISEDAQPNERDIEAASKAGLTSEAFRVQWSKFRNYHLSRGNLMADWSAAWRTWLGNIGQFTNPRASPQSQSGMDYLSQRFLNNLRAEQDNDQHYGNTELITIN